MPSRRDLLAALAAVGTAGCIGDSGTGGPSTGTPRRSGEPARTGTAVRTDAPTGSAEASPSGTAATPSGPAVRWTRELGGSVDHRPTVRDGTLYVAGGTNENTPPGDREYLRPAAGENLYALSLGGEERWRYEARAGVEGRPRVVAGGVHGVVGWNAGTHGVDQRLVRIVDGERRWETGVAKGYLSVLGSHDGTTFVGSSDDAMSLSGETTHAVARDGSERWRVESGDSQEGIVHEGTLYVPYAFYRTTALDVEAGEERWAKGMPPAGGDLRVFGDVLYLRAEEEDADGNYPLVAVDAATGEERWRYASEGGDDGPFVPTGAVEDEGNDRTYGTEYGGLLFALDSSTGEEVWRYPVDAETPSPPGFADGTAYLPAQDGTLHAVAPDGERRWTRSAGGHLTALHANETGVVAARGSGGGRYGLTAFAHDGTERWSFTHPGRLSPAAVLGGEAYVGTEGGFVIALG